VDPQQLAVAVDVLAHVLERPEHVHGLAVAAVVQDLEADQLGLPGDPGQQLGPADQPVLDPWGLGAGRVEDSLHHSQIGAPRQLGWEAAGDDAGHMGAVAVAVDQGLAEGRLARLGEVAVQVGHVALEGLVAAEVLVVGVDARVQDRPGDAAAGGVEGAPGRVRLDGGT
jgi:hypothetical protein